MWLKANLRATIKKRNIYVCTKNIKMSRKDLCCNEKANQFCSINLWWDKIKSELNLWLELLYMGVLKENLIFFQRIFVYLHYIQLYRKGNLRHFIEEHIWNFSTGCNKRAILQKLQSSKHDVGPFLKNVRIWALPIWDYHRLLSCAGSCFAKIPVDVKILLQNYIKNL